MNAANPGQCFCYFGEIILSLFINLNQVKNSMTLQSTRR